MKTNGLKLTLIVSLISLLFLSSSIGIGSAQRYTYVSLVVTVNNQDGGSVYPGSGVYGYGDYVVLTETTNPTYSFSGWYLNGNYMGKTSSLGIYMTQDCQVQAVFVYRLPTLSVSVNPVNGGSVLVTSNGLVIGNAVPYYYGNFSFGSVVSVSAAPRQGCSFSAWYIDGAYQGSNTDLSVTMNNDHQVNALFSGSPTNNSSPTPTPVPTATSSPTTTPPPTPSPTPTPNLPIPALTFFCKSSTVSSGFNVQLEGMLTYQGVGLSSSGLLLSYSVTGGSTWQDLAYVITDNSGMFSATWMPSASGNYMVKATWPGDSAYGRTSLTINFAVQPLQNSEQNVFSVSSNSTLSSLAFNSKQDELSFSVSGPTGSTGYVQVCVPKTLLSQASDLQVLLDGTQVTFQSIDQGDIWLITFMYHHSTHQVTMSLGNPATPDSGNGGVIGFLSGQIVFIAVIAVLVVVIAALLIVNMRKGRVKAESEEGL